MKKKIIILAMLILFVGCTKKTDEKNIPKENVDKNYTEEHLLKALNNETKVIDENNNELLLSEYKLPSDENIVIEKTTFVDLDSDGNNELVALTKSNYGAYIILRYENNMVYVYTINIRSLNNLKEDGTFIGNNGSQSYTYMKLSFNKNLYETKILAEVNETENIYKINEKDVSKQTFLDYENEFNNKKDCEWNIK